MAVNTINHSKLYDEDDLLPISALQHLLFCERQWALIHLERTWEENRSTAEGRLLHERADEPDTESHGDVRIARGLQLRSLRLGLAGKADVVEFHRTSESPSTETVVLEGLPGRWRPVIVEYKRGRPKIDRIDAVQICAQALCLEEMLAVSIPSGFFFYGRPRRRYDVTFDAELRRQTEALVERLHELTRAAKTPLPEYNKQCLSCSLINVCLPKVPYKKASVMEYLVRAITEVETE